MTSSNGARPAHHTVVAIVEDKPGVLQRVAGLFRRRGFNIESLAVGHSETEGLSRMTNRRRWLERARRTGREAAVQADRT